jgi:hypothetical protein
LSYKKDLTAKDIALIICFTTLYAVLASIPIFQILGMPSKYITAAAITTPIMGFLLGPYIGALSATLGGTITFFAGNFYPPSFVSGIVTAYIAGLQCTGKRIMSVLMYFLFLVFFCFYPSIGPFWLFPQLIWFQTIGLLILISPLGSVAINNVKTSSNRKLVLSFFIISLTSTLAGQISGSLTNVLCAQAGILPLPQEGWQALWVGLTIIYPIERIVIALSAASIGASLFKVLRSANLTKLISRDGRREKSP